MPSSDPLLCAARFDPSALPRRAYSCECCPAFATGLSVFSLPPLLPVNLVHAHLLQRAPCRNHRRSRARKSRRLTPSAPTISPTRTRQQLTPFPLAQSSSPNMATSTMVSARSPWCVPIRRTPQRRLPDAVFPLVRVSISQWKTYLLVFGLTLMTSNNSGAIQSMNTCVGFSASQSAGCMPNLTHLTRSASPRPQSLCK